MISNQKFDVEIIRSLAPTGLRWPTRSEATNEANLGCNRAYADLRGLTWKETQRVFDEETLFIERLEATADSAEEYNLIMDELYEDDQGLLGLDIGVASTVVALSAAGCVPCSSCNAGAYGGTHSEVHPVVAFFAQAHHVELLLRCAEVADVGLESDTTGIVTAYADDIRNMRKFADALMQAKAQFRAAARTKVRKRDAEVITAPSPPEGADQLKLPLE
jgi:hypothetical protein